MSSNCRNTLAARPEDRSSLGLFMGGYHVGDIVNGIGRQDNNIIILFIVHTGKEFIED